MMSKKIFSLTFCLLFSSGAFAYLDPATGGSLLQMLLIGGASAVVFMWGHIKGLFFWLKNFILGRSTKKSISEGGHQESKNIKV